MPTKRKIRPHVDSQLSAIDTFDADVCDSVEYLTMPVHHNVKAALNSMNLLYLHPVQHESRESKLISHVPGFPIINPPQQHSKVNAIWHDSRLMYQHTRMSPTEFSIIVDELTPFLNKPYDEGSEFSSRSPSSISLETPCSPHTSTSSPSSSSSSTSSLPSTPSSSSSPSSPSLAPRRLEWYSHRLLDPHDQLLLWCYFSDTNYAESISMLFDISIRTVSNIADHVTRAISKAYLREIEWPDEEERKSLYGLFSVHPNAIVLLDGTHCRIVVPSDKEAEDQTFSGYKNHHTQNHLVYTDGLGFFRLIEGPFPGKPNDRSLFTQSVLFKSASTLLSEGEEIIIKNAAGAERVALDGERIVADGGFAGQGPLHCPVKYDVYVRAQEKCSNEQEQ